MDNQQTTEPTLSKNQRKKQAALEHNKTVNTTPTEVLTTAQKEELEALSKEVFNSTSRYATLLRDGEVVPETYTATEYVPDENGGEGTTRVVQVPVLVHNSKSPVLKVVRHTYTTVKALMVEIKDKQDRFRAMMKKMEDDKTAALYQLQLKQDVQKALGGSAV